MGSCRTGAHFDRNESHVIYGTRHELTGNTEKTAKPISPGRRLTNKVAVVFGGGSVGAGWGNGKATAVAFAREAATVVAIDLNQKAAEETADIIDNEGGNVIALSADVTQSAAVENLVSTVIEKFGRTDILHNNVGLGRIGGPLELSEAEWHKAIDVNLTSIFITCKATLPWMLCQRSGIIINISSIAAIRYTGYDYISYYAAKAAVNQFTVGLALQYAGDGIRVNAIMPGMMDTPHIYQDVLTQYSSIEEMQKARNAVRPMGRMGTARDIANAAVFLASDESSYITGVCIPVDGGLTCRAG
jgi:NAD(P)-dependent dehydrogenase (short-subunit alcohol dehydrogenase family)